MSTFAELFPLPLPRVVYVVQRGEERAQVVRGLDLFGHHADGLVTHVEVDVVFTPNCLEAALLQDSRCRDF